MDIAAIRCDLIREIKVAETNPDADKRFYRARQIIAAAGMDALHIERLELN